MPQRVLIPLPGVGTLALDEETYRRALQECAKFNPPPEPTIDQRDGRKPVENAPAKGIKAGTSD